MECNRACCCSWWSLVFWRHGRGGFVIDALRCCEQTLGVDVRKTLLEFHQQYYSANLMRVSVVGRQSLDELQRLVESKFSAIDNSDASVSRDPEHPFTDACLGQTVYYHPLRELKKVNYLWRIPLQPMGELHHSHWFVFSTCCVACCPHAWLGRPPCDACVTLLLVCATGLCRTWWATKALVRCCLPFGALA